MADQTPITHYALRCRGFRIDSTNCDCKPHMVFVHDRRNEFALEVSESHGGQWHVWLRSDMAHSRCRFCHVRMVRFVEQLDLLVLAITDSHLPTEEKDPEDFGKALELERAECERRYGEYCRNERFAHVPGG